jgi:L-aspartate oxidase
VVTDLWGRTAIPRLYAAGETAMTGLHGANRLASNSLLEAAVMGRRAFAAVSEALHNDSKAPPEFPEWDPGRAARSEQRVLITHSWDEIRRLMWNYVGIVRSGRRLERAFRRIQLLKQEIHSYYWDHLLDSDLIELRNLVTVAELVVRCAMARKESRGLHYTIDYPEHGDDQWLRDSVIRRDDLQPATSPPA